MHYHLDIELTEEEYLAFNVYQNWDSPHGKSTIIRARMVLIAFGILLLVIGLWRGHFSMVAMLGQLPLVIVSVLVQLFINKRWLRRAMKGQLRTMKKKGKLPFDPSATMEFFDDKFTERTAEKYTESTYAQIERITLVGDTMLYLHNNAIGAYLVPRTAFDTDEDFAAFTAFITEQCEKATVVKTA